MQFKTEINLEKANTLITESQPQVWIGSCFAESMGNRLLEAKFPVLVNPFGTVFNPISLFKQLISALEDKNVTECKFLQYEFLHYHFDFHSELRAKTQIDLRNHLLELKAKVKTQLLESKYLVITFGTAYAYYLNTSGEIVANCHKQPASQFTKKLLSVETIVEGFSGLYQSLQKHCPQLEILLTVSPVRHLKDTLLLNSVSKSTLRLATHQICEQFENVSYFPAYEFLLDDLRDYRFYESDMLHPSHQAQEYIWQKFQESLLTDSAQHWLKEWKGISLALNHRPFNPESEAHQKFLKNTLQKIQAHHPKFNLGAEIEYIQSQIIS
jgi:hypothetical protein